MSDNPFRRQIARPEFEAMVGQEIGVSRWFVMDQARIDAFAQVTEDEQFIHVDPDRAKETMFGGTVAPVPSGSELRARFQLDRIEEKSPGRLMASVGVSVEIKGCEKPALTADWRVMYLI